MATMYAEITSDHFRCRRAGARPGPRLRAVRAGADGGDAVERLPPASRMKRKPATTKMRPDGDRHLVESRQWSETAVSHAKLTAATSDQSARGAKTARIRERAGRGGG